MTTRAANIIRRIAELAAISEDSHAITRRFGTPAAMAAAEKLLAWMQAAGLQTRIDAIGNIRGIWPSANPNAKTFVIASHYDSVVNAGRWDGPLGVLAGLDILENIARRKKSFPFHLELIAFSDEEGVRFHSTYLGSKVVAGSFDSAILQRADYQGITLEKAIRAIGGDPSDIPAEAIPNDQWLGYFELHIEQGPVLYTTNIPVAPVTAIAGQRRVEATFKGTAGHAGTTPMDMRQDALCGAAEFILAAESFAATSTSTKPHPTATPGDPSTSALLATIGKLHIPGAASNTIPGETTISVDIRHPDDATLATAHDKLRTLAATIAARRGLTLDWNLIQSSSPVACDPRLTQLIIQSIESKNYPVIPLVSGAGHDAVAISAVSPVCMLFVRCFEGISHNPKENVDPEDLAAALAVADDFIGNLTKI